MKRILFALSLAGAMMTVSVMAYAQSAAPREKTGSIEKERADCVDLSRGVAPTKSARELHASLDDPAPAEEAKEPKAPPRQEEAAAPRADEETQPRASC